MTNGEKKPCDICKKIYGVGYLPEHRRKAHGVRGGISGIIRRTPEEMDGPGTGKTLPRRGRRREDARKSTGRGRPIEDPNRLFDEAEFHPAEVIEAIENGRGAWRERLTQPTGFTVAPFVVLEDSDGGIWLAEKIR